LQHYFTGDAIVFNTLNAICQYNGTEKVSISAVSVPGGINFNDSGGVNLWSYRSRNSHMGNK